MIHAFAIEPELAASWGRRENFRFIRDKFGFGTPRVMLELPAFKNWKRMVYEAVTSLDLADLDRKRVEEILRLFGDHRYRRGDDPAAYDGSLDWLRNAESEYDRKPFAAILAGANPRSHEAVIPGDLLGESQPRWACASGANPARTPEALAAVLSPMLANCRQLHLIDPYFGARHHPVVEALAKVLEGHAAKPTVVRVHCRAGESKDPALSHFESEAKRMALRLPAGLAVQFARWKQRPGGDRLHNRYVLTDLGGVALGVGLDSGEGTETDDVLLLPREQYLFRWAQYVEDNGAFDRVDTPAPVQGSGIGRARREQE